MAYNSDGYIMIDFTEVDFRRTNQTIEGLYKRCVDVIGTNKFILVINANGRTPLPATCSFTNNQYVIDTCIYMFAISSNDNLFIRRNDVPASDIIDDSSISVDKTWSSNKIDTELDTKADASALADYQPLLTPVSPVSIENNNISVDLSGKQDTLTAGDNISIVNNVISADLSGKQDTLTAGDDIRIDNNVISADVIKHFTYIGNGNNPSVIQFPIKPKYILGIYANKGNDSCYLLPTIVGLNHGEVHYSYRYISTPSPVNRCVNLSFDDITNKLTIDSQFLDFALNSTDIEYTVYYI